MIKSLSTKTCAFDCEWAPCPVTARRLLHLPADTSDRQAVEAVWRHYAAKNAQRAGRQPAPDERPFLKLVLSQVVSIACVLRDVQGDGKPTIQLVSISAAQSPEAKMLQRFLEFVAGKEYQLWGFNSANADLPILTQRALALGVPCPTFSKRPDKPWNGYDYFDSRASDAHMDIAELIGGRAAGSAMPSLDELAVACGIPGKLDVAGSEVADLYLAGRIPEIVEYNETDAVTTHLLMLRIGLHTGHLSPEQYQTEIGAVETLVKQQIGKGKRQFKLFSDAWIR